MGRQIFSSFSGTFQMQMVLAIFHSPGILFKVTSSKMIYGQNMLHLKWEFTYYYVWYFVTLICTTTLILTMSYPFYAVVCTGS